jgi:hypothetical protein
MGPLAALLPAIIGVGGSIISSSMASKGPGAPAPPAPTNPALDGGRGSMVGTPLQKMKPGQRANAQGTGPQGILTPATTGRSTLLGN